ncbi:hypothetical protein MACH09_15470 [Vibrio sp. MACH09]|uniref:GNAT family N-acetyltransferase n=1 Tax=unclassified Vibrio TaxID=2614977 RepID=UPI001493AF7B|nr:MULTISPECIES: GNAT family N-acetyltransferase [unclassified Vibrio]NOI65523.1 GNAT family N-acetyltransferase [Vibrio sp. 99-8-1]GLO61039.1 hypothetical protein MACH09_15470 [Vibrio sp. MACH09]
MITIRKAKFKDYASLMEMEVTDEQKPYVTNFNTLYEHRTPEQEFYVINEGKELLGFFMLDKSYSRQYTFAQQKELGLRNFLIAKQHQGKGYAKQALNRLFLYLYGAYADFNCIGLTVNKKNTLAYKLYLDVGFSDTETIYHGGEAGAQHVLRKDIN